MPVTRRTPDERRVRWQPFAGFAAVQAYLPSAAGIVVMTGSGDPYTAVTALVVLLVWAAAAVLGGHAVLRLRDAT